MGFQKVVLIIALVIFSFSLLFIAAMISKNNSKKKWPPETATCPPFFEVRENSGQIQCKQINEERYTENKCKMFPSGITESLTDKSNSEKCTWANSCGIVWDGITQKNGSCDEASDV